ncbi:WhiB family transcriptional regulator [Pseudonocardia sp. S2-4]|uniref:Transcriptional regulator WhiB n=1 Tax=Pseudonocardia humida TaxID=2800819 RepID=A0ABT1A5B5_9PSEU|nr:WhiB family transcriptional regulator [Pseudonocardia humida]
MDWRQWAACQDVDPELFVPSTESGPACDEQVSVAKAVCDRCPVRAQCLAEALVRMPYGIAGGLTEHERRRLAHRQGRTRWVRTCDVDVEEIARVGTGGEVEAAGRALLASGRAPREVARRCEVSVRTAQRWAAACRSVRAVGLAMVVLGLLLGGWRLVCSCECMTCALGQHCGACRTGTHRPAHSGTGGRWQR